MTILCIDTGTKNSGYVIVKDGGVRDGEIIPNDALYLALTSETLTIHPDLVIIEMITSFGGRYKSAQITESILVIGRIMQILSDRNIRYERISRQQIVSFFLKGKSNRADTKIRALMRDKLGIGKSRHPILKRDLWQAYALYEFARINFFQRWYVPNLETPKKEKSDPEKTKERKKKYLDGQIKKFTNARAQLEI